MYNFSVTYFTPSAPQQVTPLPPAVLTVQATEFIYDENTVIFVDGTQNPPVYKLAIPLELMPIITNGGSV